MKKILSLLLSAAVMIGCTSCNNEGGEDFHGSASASDNGETSEKEAETDNINHDNPRVDYTREEAAEIIKSVSNFKLSDNFYVCAPKSIDHASKFYSNGRKQPSPEESLEEFLRAYEYLFPNHELDKDCLLYYYDDPNEAHGDLLEDDKLEGWVDYRLHILYDKDNYERFLNDDQLAEDWRTGAHGGFLFYNESNKPQIGSVSVTLRTPVGSDLCSFNKGLYQRITKGIEDDEPYYAYEHFSPGIEYGWYPEYIGSYAPDSEEVFRLYDKEISVKDAVAFFEGYVDGIPTSAKPAYKIHVNSVEIYKTDADTYYYYFMTSEQYDGIHFDYYTDGTRGRPDETRTLGYGGMARSDDVDYLYGAFKAFTVTEETAYTELVSLEEAVKIASENLTEYVSFQVTRAELLYCSEGNIGGDMLGEVKEPIYPAWKFTLINPNDDLAYAAYVNALTGEFKIYR